MQHRLLLSILLFSTICHVLGNFQDGEIVPTSRRGQFHGSRTVWHDLMGRHCPRFARDSKVAIPIPKPIGLQSGELSYKLQLSLSDRVLSPWVQIIGRSILGPPIVLVQLEHIGDALKSAKATVVPLNPEYVRDHQQILREFQNATIWPKHLLVHYTWKHTNPINVNLGLYLVLILGILATGILGVSVIASYQDKLKTFVADIAGEEAAGPARGNAWQKAD